MVNVHHITFSPSAAGSLKEAFRVYQIQASVSFLPDDYTLGPINNPEHQSRIAFIRTFLADCPYLDDILDYSEETESFWKNVTDTSRPVLIWYSRRCAHEYTGFLELLSRIPYHKDLKTIDISKYQVLNPGSGSLVTPHSCGECSPAMFNSLLRYVYHLKNQEFSQFTAEWAEISQEKGSFRIIREGKLQNTPLSWYDEDLFSLVPDTWIPSARIVGDG